jgi:hypothetical protein
MRQAAWPMRQGLNNCRYWNPRMADADDAPGIMLFSRFGSSRKSLSIPPRSGIPQDPNRRRLGDIRDQPKGHS